MVIVGTGTGLEVFLGEYVLGEVGGVGWGGVWEVLFLVEVFVGGLNLEVISRFYSVGR